MADNSTRTDLFSPVKLGKIELANRIVMAPLTRGRVNEEGVPNELNVTYYVQRASAGLIISEATNISAQGRGYAMTPGIWTERQVAEWRKVTDAVHAAGGKIVMQLWHVGRNSHVDLQPNGASPVAPSAIKAGGNVYTAKGIQEPSIPRALNTDEILGIIEQYRHAAEYAKLAGFDGVEIHSANNYLLEQFIRDSTNHRTDQYGGSIENRVRLVLEVVEAVTGVWGSGRVGIRLSPVTTEVGNTPLDSNIMETYGYLIQQLNPFKLAYLHFVEGTTGKDRIAPENVDLDILRSLFEGAYIGNNNYDLEMAISRRSESKIDAVAFGRPFISNPDLVNRLRYSIELTSTNSDTHYGHGEKGYIDWPNANY
ncbi:alkene reductase [Xenorhabdus innexi]|uniref:Alkene reductase n=1 Tax=Xenorhabdus innexi TaxID=290109 RepID=A0A1N6MXX9_9GAMM|nr:alkene reductase [Xenorhabdus innexi]PHM33115.1 alkene reductase [Xenorhabdus innexi]SIP73637.1 N-ethylmaleimide reductase [Xenorhabdus innexi]